MSLKPLSAEAGSAFSRAQTDDPANRETHDFYPTWPAATRALLSVERFEGGIWEPACGDGAISDVLLTAGYPVISTDLIDRGYGDGGRDFLAEWTALAPNIVTNPPSGQGRALPPPRLPRGRRARRVVSNHPARARLGHVAPRSDGAGQARQRGRRPRRDRLRLVRLGARARWPADTRLARLEGLLMPFAPRGCEAPRATSHHRQGELFAAGTITEGAVA